MMPMNLDVILRNRFAKKSLGKYKLLTTINGEYGCSFLLVNRYMEITDDVVTLLNQDWLFRPQMRFFAAKALSGAILVDPLTSKAILINTIELYGRSIMVDAHHERCLNKRGIPASSTNPPVDCRCKRVCDIYQRQ